MQDSSLQDELYHEIFGSILDRTEMNPYLLKKSDGYEPALCQATCMMGNRGFDISGSEGLRESEKERAQVYVRQVRSYYEGWLFPFVRGQLEQLALQGSPIGDLYMNSIRVIDELESLLRDKQFGALVDADPRHLFLLASSRKYPDLFGGCPLVSLPVEPSWQRMGCSILKMCHLVKAIEEESQDIHDYAQLGLFLGSKGKSLSDLFAFNWDSPSLIPAEEPARRAFVKLSTFFHKMKESMTWDAGKECFIFNSGDGVEVDIVAVKARLKSPESMFTKLGKDEEGEIHDIRDILALTFLIRSREDTLTLFHALQKRGVILQENTVSHSITQTLFESPDDMTEAVRRLMVGLARSAGTDAEPEDRSLETNARLFFKALNVNAGRNQHSSGGHKKFQCKINFSIPIHRDAGTGAILVPGTDEYAARDCISVTTQQHTLPVELRISDEQSWESSERRGDAHHDAYKCRQLLALMNRLFFPVFSFPRDQFPLLREDQNRLFSR